MTRVAYLVPDLSDPAVGRRLRMLQAGGATPTMIGFRRTEQPIVQIEGSLVHDLGRTYDARMTQRASKTLGWVVRPAEVAAQIQGCDVLMARNLEMLAIAQAARRAASSRARLVYEALDIHRLLLGKGLASRGLRAVERGLLRSCDGLVVSSPAFLTSHFARYPTVPKPLLVENKVLQLGESVLRPSADRPPGPPWRIGWFGMLRCAKSLNLLRNLVQHASGAVEVVIRGRPAYTEFADFGALVTSMPGLYYKGPYHASDLAEAYREVHCCWAIDYFEDGLNSQWLLPNRLYEGGFHQAVAIARGGTETSNWLASHSAGVSLTTPEEELQSFFRTLTEARYKALVQATAAIPTDALVATLQDCVDLVTALANGVAKH